MKSGAMRAVFSLLAALALAAAVAAGVVDGPARATAPPSPFLGVNMSFFGADDAMLTHKGTRELFRSWGVPFVRVPLRDRFDGDGAPIGDDLLLSAMRAVKDVGATPMLVIRGPGKDRTTAEVKATDVRLLKLVHRVFGDGTAYLEFGNEPDLAGVPAAGYTAAWNAVVPALKSAYPKAAYDYVGPVVSRVDHRYAGYVGDFVAGAKPTPDYLSWHEYVCGAATGRKNTCVSHATDHDNFGLVTGVDTITPQGEAFRAALTGGPQLSSDTPGSDRPGSRTPGSGPPASETPGPATPGSPAPEPPAPSSQPPSSSGNRYYVAPNGDDTNGDGSRAHPWATIQHAAEHVTVARGGATVHVADGVYKDAVENETSGHAGGYLTFVADHRWKAKIAPASSGIPFENRADYVRVEGFDVTGAGGAWSGILTWGEHNVIRGNHVHDIRTRIGPRDCDGSPGGDGIGDDSSSAHNAFIGNWVDHIGPYPRECEYIHGIYPSGAGDVIQNNVTYDSSGSGIRFNHNAVGATITNNLSFANADHGIFISGDADATADKFVISNNIVRDNAKFGIDIRADANGTGNQYHDNLFFHNKKGAYGKDSSEEFTPPNTSGTLNADPEMVGYRADGTGDYHLTAASPCVDAGDTAGAPGQDYDGASRPHGRAVDIGPYEFRAATSPAGMN